MTHPAILPYYPIIASFADGAAVPIPLVEALILVESGGDPEVWNPEPPYRYLVDPRTGKPFRKLTREEIASEVPPKDFPNCPGLKSPVDAEWWGQQASWGLLQTMGAVAREHGFRGNFPSLCAQPLLSLKYGIYHLGWLRKRFLEKYGWKGVVAAYNTGGPEFTEGAGLAYVTKVANVGGFNFMEGIA